MGTPAGAVDADAAVVDTTVVAVRAVVEGRTVVVGALVVAEAAVIGVPGPAGDELEVVPLTVEV